MIPDPTCAAFFSLDPVAVRAAIADLERDEGPAVRSAAPPIRTITLGFVNHPEGLFSPAIFGDDVGRRGHLDLPGVVHPAALPEVASRLGLPIAEVVAVVEGRGALIEGRFVPEGDDTLGAPTGPGVVADLLPDIDLVRIRRVPVPPPAERPFVTGLGPTMTDPWIGPWGEAWAALVRQARRATRLLELDAPPIILRNEAAMLQRAFAEVWSVTRAPKRVTTPTARPPRVQRLIPALARPMPGMRRGTVVALANAGDRLVVQRAGDVLVLDPSGRLLARHAPSGCHLRGTSDGVAIFRDYVQHPYLGATGFGTDHVTIDAEGTTFVAHTDVEASALDLRSGRLAEAALGAHVANDEPEDLFLEGENGERIPVHVGGDRPQALAWAPGMRFAWVGEGEESMVIDLGTGIPQCFPAAPEDTTEALSLRTGALRKRRWEAYDDDVSAAAVVFDGGTWRFLWSTGVLADAAGARRVRLTPAPRAAAFGPDGSLAVYYGREVVVLDDALRVASRFALPR